MDCTKWLSSFNSGNETQRRQYCRFPFTGLNHVLSLGSCTVIQSCLSATPARKVRCKSIKNVRLNRLRRLQQLCVRSAQRGLRPDRLRHLRHGLLLRLWSTGAQFSEFEVSLYSILLTTAEILHHWGPKKARARKSKSSTCDLATKLGNIFRLNCPPGQVHRSRAGVCPRRRHQCGSHRRPLQVGAQPRPGLHLLHPGCPVGNGRRRLADSDKWWGERRCAVQYVHHKMRPTLTFWLISQSNVDGL